MKYIMAKENRFGAYETLPIQQS